MTYKTLREKLLGLTEEQLDQNVTICFEDDECYPILRLYIEPKTDIIDEGHVVLGL